MINIKLTNPVHWFAVGFGAGLLPKAPGTWGTLVAIPLYFLMAGLPWWLYLKLCVFGFLIGIYICDKTARDCGVHDHGSIVWDEIIGFLLACFAMPRNVLFVVLAFFIFRLFDVWKPWPIRFCDRRLGGGFGIMFDDVLAGIYSWICLQICAVLLGFPSIFVV